MNPWTVAGQAALSIECSKQEYWRGLPCLFLGDLPDPGLEPRPPALQADSLPSEPQVKSLVCRVCVCVYVCIPLISNIYLSLDF